MNIQNVLTGATAFTRIPSEAHSIAKDLVKLSNPLRAAPECLKNMFVTLTM